MKRTRTILSVLCSIALAVGMMVVPTNQAYAGAHSSNYVTSWTGSDGLSQFYFYGKKVKTAGASGICIDVSHWDGNIDWAKAKAAGVSSAIIGCGWVYNEVTHQDSKWLKNVKGAMAAGVKVGVYIYSYAYSASTAKAEADFVLKSMKEAGITTSNISLPVYFDMENTEDGVPGAQGHKNSKKKLAQEAQAFCDTIAAEGYSVGIYASTSWWKEYLTNEVFDNTAWSRWVAQYNKLCEMCTTASGAQDEFANYGTYLDLWQFTSQATIDGINTFCDVSFQYKQFKNEKYTITYNLKKGTMPSSYATSYKITKAVNLPVPTRKGYGFIGWYKNEAHTGKYVTRILKGTTGNKTYYGAWKKGARNYVVKTKTRFVRAKASLSAKTTAKLRKGESACIIKTKKVGKVKWGKVYGKGWIMMKYLKKC